MLCLTLYDDNEIHLRTVQGDIVIQLNDSAKRGWKKENGARLTIQAPREIAVYRRSRKDRTEHGSATDGQQGGVFDGPSGKETVGN